MTIPIDEEAQTVGPRLDSWKAIAAYLDRDERTVRRWEHQGLPIRRVAGARGNSVFAYPAEIDAWLNRDREAPPVAALAPPAAGPVRRPWIVAASVAAAVILVITWRGWHAAVRGDEPLTIRLTPEAVVATSATGEGRWQHVLPSDERTLFAAPAFMTGGAADVIVPIADRMRRADGTPLSGRLLRFDRGGRLASQLDFDDRLSFGQAAYGPPWVLTDIRMEDRGGRRRFAAALHHYRWWPSFVTVFDDRLERLGTFVNAGWIEQVRWVAQDRLLVAGFSNAFDAGFVAVLDASALAGRSPVGPDTGFDCSSCGEVVTAQYVVLPRSEVNRLTGSEFNRATIDGVDDGRIVIRTNEVPADGRSGAAEILYEFTPTLELLGASFNDRYRDMHRRLETQGLAGHPAGACPDRTPGPIRTWGPAGWRTRIH